MAPDYPFADRDDLRRPGLAADAFRREAATRDDPTNWWIPNRACAEAMLRSAGFEIADHPEDEVYICKRTATRQAGVSMEAPWSKP